MENENIYTVYVKINSDGYITNIASSAVLSDPTGWIEIDKGVGEKYAHSQSKYFPGELWTESNACRYKLLDSTPVECSADEIARQEETRKPKPTPTLENRVKTLEDDTADLSEALEMLLSGVVE